MLLSGPAEGCCYLPLYQTVSNSLLLTLMGPGVVALRDLLAQLSMACLALGTSTQVDQELGFLQWLPAEWLTLH